MVYDNTFNINKYFEKNYGLQDKPKEYVFKKKPLLILILLFPVWIIVYILGKSKANTAIKQWEDALQYRYNNWYKEFDQFYNKAVQDMNLYNSALNKVGLVADDPELQEVKPFYIYGPLFDGYYRKKTDGGYRSSSYEFTYFFFKKEQIYFYTRKLNLLDLTKKSESTLEFFFQDITSVSISSVSITPKGKNADNVENKEDIERDSFILVVPGDKISYAYTPNDEVSNSIRGMKQLIRERKNNH